MFSGLVRPLIREIPKIASRRTLTSSSQIPKDVWKLGRLNHIAIATPDLPNSIALYKDVFGANVR